MTAHRPAGAVASPQPGQGRFSAAEALRQSTRPPPHAHPQATHTAAFCVRVTPPAERARAVPDRGDLQAAHHCVQLPQGDQGGCSRLPPPPPPQRRLPIGPVTACLTEVLHTVRLSQGDEGGGMRMWMWRTCAHGPATACCGWRCGCAGSCCRLLPLLLPPWLAHLHRKGVVRRTVKRSADRPGLARHLMCSALASLPLVGARPSTCG